jgi:hypothetical protein
MITSQRAELPSEINDYFVTWTGLGLFSDSRLSPSEADILNRNVSALVQHDRDDLVRDFLVAVKDAGRVSYS